MISDLLDPSVALALRAASHRHDMIAIILEDPREMEFPNVGLIELRDAETGEREIIDTGDRSVRREYAERATAARQDRSRMLHGAKVDSITVRTDRPYVEALFRFFRQREKRH